ncbi:MAG: hypothetical protein GY794_05855, partial [bacterium]|nr:hypothetical protein [bacterium]
MSKGTHVKTHGGAKTVKKRFLSPLADVVLNRRIRPLLIVSLYAFLIFPIFRVAVFFAALFFASHEAVQNTTIWGIVVSLSYGFQFDAVIVGYT